VALAFTQRQLHADLLGPLLHHHVHDVGHPTPAKPKEMSVRHRA
jgi:hypothetical protein